MNRSTSPGMTSRAPANNSSGTKSVAAALRERLAPREIRQKGARAELPGSLGEKVETLIVLLDDEEEQIRRDAQRTLDALDPAELAQLVSDPVAPQLVLEFAIRQLAPANRILAGALLENPALAPEHQDLLLEQLRAEILPAGDSAENANVDSPEPARETLLQHLSRMNSAQKIKRALLGSREERLILIRDSNKIVARAVVQSPKLSEAEVEAFASMKNVSEEVLRLIAANRGYLKSYSVVHALSNNSRAPLDVTLRLLGRLTERDIKALSVNRNIPDALRKAAVQRLSKRQEARMR